LVFHFHRTVFLAELGEALARSGEVAEGLAERAVVLACVDGSRGSFRQALDMARQQNALSLELQSATSLARLYHRQRRRAQARNVLALLYGRFAEGFGGM
jgi:hypothetical protein